MYVKGFVPLESSKARIWLLSFNRTILNLRFISNSLLPITLPLRTHYIIKKRKIKAHFQTLNPYSAENLSKEIRVGDRSRNFVNPYLVQAGGLLPIDCCYSGKIEVNTIVLYLYQETYNQQVTKNSTLQGILPIISWRSRVGCLALPRWHQLRSTSRNYIYTTEVCK